MLESFIPLVITSLCVAIAVWAVFMWAIKSGQFDDIEGPKHRMLDDDDEEEPPQENKPDDDKTETPDEKEDGDERNN